MSAAAWAPIDWRDPRPYNPQKGDIWREKSEYRGAGKKTRVAKVTRANTQTVYFTLTTSDGRKRKKVPLAKFLRIMRFVAPASI